MFKPTLFWTSCMDKFAIKSISSIILLFQNVLTVCAQSVTEDVPNVE